MTSNGGHGKASGRASKEGEGKRQRKSSNINISEDDKTLLQHNNWLKGLPLLTPAMCEPDADPNLANITDKIAKMWKSDFCWGSCFEPSFLAAIMYEGFLPTAHGGMDGPKEFVLLPKLHLERCIVHFPDLHIRKSWRRQAKHFTMSIDKLFDQVVDKCLKQHGESWLHPPIVDGFKRLFHSGGCGQVRMHSVELYKDGELVAGELGFSAGTSYCSLSGFSSASCAGSVQCVALAVHLHRSGMAMWDLGMGMAYKHTMGAKDIARLKFLAELHAARDKPVQALAISASSTGDLIRLPLPIGGYVEVTQEHVQHAGRVGRVAAQAGAWVRVWLEREGAEPEAECFPPQALRPLFLEEQRDIPVSLSAGPGATGRKRRRRRGAKPNEESAERQTPVPGSDTAMAESEGDGVKGGGGAAAGGVACGWERKVQHHREWEQLTSRRKKLREYLQQLLSERQGRGAASKRSTRRLQKLTRNEQRRAAKGTTAPQAPGE